MRMVRTSSAVRNISKKSPRAVLIPSNISQVSLRKLPPRFVVTFMVPGRRADVIAAATIPPISCATVARIALSINQKSFRMGMPDGCNLIHQEHGQGNSRVKQTSRYTKEYPCVYK